MRTFDTQYRAKSKHKELESFKRFVDEPFDFQIARRESPRKRVLRAELKAHERVLSSVKKQKNESENLNLLYEEMILLQSDELSYLKKETKGSTIMSMQQEAEMHTLLQELQRKEEGILENENNLKKLKEETSQGDVINV